MVGRKYASHQVSSKDFVPVAQAVRRVESRIHAFEHRSRQQCHILRQTYHPFRKSPRHALDTREELCKVEPQNEDVVLEFTRLPQHAICNERCIKRAMPRDPSFVVLTRASD